MAIRDNVCRINEELVSLSENRPGKQPVSLIGVTKYASLDQMRELIATGVTRLGESRIQDVEKKQEVFGRDGLEWHLIGHLQTNKVKKAVRMFDCIQSVDSMRLMRAINAECVLQNITIPVFIQIKISDEETKYGYDVNEFERDREELFSFPNALVKGIMIIGKNCSEQQQIREEFTNARRIFEKLKMIYPNVTELSMGMSADYCLAIEAGSTMVRIGSVLFEG